MEHTLSIYEICIKMGAQDLSLFIAVVSSTEEWYSTEYSWTTEKPRFGVTLTLNSREVREHRLEPEMK